MNIAIIEDDKDYQELLSYRIKEEKKDCQIDFFNNADDFGKSDLGKYHAIISDINLPDISGKSLLKSIGNKTKAHLALMTTDPAKFATEDVFDDRLSGLLNKRDIETVITWLTHIIRKSKLDRMISESEKQLSTMTSITNGLVNGYNLDIKDGVIILGLSNLLSRKSKTELLKELANNEYKLVIYYTDKMVTDLSTYLGQLAFLVNITAENKGKLAFVKSKNKSLMEQLQLSNIDKVLDIFESEQDAINFVNGA